MYNIIKRFFRFSRKRQENKDTSVTDFEKRKVFDQLKCTEIIQIESELLCVDAFDQLKLELTWPTDFEKVRQIISANKHLLNEPIGDHGEYVLHYACKDYAPSNIVIEFIKGNPLAVQQKDDCGEYPLHYACKFKQSESVIQLLVNEYPLAIQQKDNDGNYPLHYACWKNQSESVIQLLIKEYPLAVQEKGEYGYYPMHYALANIQSERVLLVLINLSLQALKDKDYKRSKFLLLIAKEYNQSSTIIKVLEELTKMSDYNLENRIGIPTIVTLHGLDNLRRNDIFQWVLYNSPILIDGEYIYLGRN